MLNDSDHPALTRPVSGKPDNGSPVGVGAQLALSALNAHGFMRTAHHGATLGRAGGLAGGVPLIRGHQGHQRKPGGFLCCLVGIGGAVGAQVDREAIRTGLRERLQVSRGPGVVRVGDHAAASVGPGQGAHGVGVNGAALVHQVAGFIETPHAPAREAFDCFAQPLQVKGPGVGTLGQSAPMKHGVITGGGVASPGVGSLQGAGVGAGLRGGVGHRDGAGFVVVADSGHLVGQVRQGVGDSGVDRLSRGGQFQHV